MDKLLVNARNTLFTALDTSFGALPNELKARIYRLTGINSFKGLFYHAVICQSLDEFEKILDSVEHTALKEGLHYKQNYDAVIKWFSENFHGKTFELFGIKTEPISEVFSFEPVEIPMSVGRLDLMFRSVSDSYYHLEEQRNMTETDLFRFAWQHFQTARHFGSTLQDIIISSGESYTGQTVLETKSGKYAPIIVDLTQKDGKKRLNDIKAAVENGDSNALFELVFLPLYGNESQYNCSELALEILRYEVKLLKEEKLFKPLFFATIIMTNKLLSYEQLKQVYEEVKYMLDILEIARQDGQQIGEINMLKNLYKQGMLSSQHYEKVLSSVQYDSKKSEEKVNLASSK